MCAIAAMAIPLLCRILGRILGNLHPFIGPAYLAPSHLGTRNFLKGSSCPSIVYIKQEFTARAAYLTIEANTKYVKRGLRMTNDTGLPWNICRGACGKTTPSSRTQSQDNTQLQIVSRQSITRSEHSSVSKYKQSC